MKEIKFKRYFFDGTANVIDVVEWGFIEHSFISPPMNSKMIYAKDVQFIGLKDKNGKEIYEGDICVNPIYIDKITVYFGNEKSMGFNYSFHYANEVRSNKNEWEIIGNTHENPELL